MIPMQQRRAEDQLVKWGYSRLMLERMDPIRVISCFYSELSKRNGQSQVSRFIELDPPNARHKKIRRMI